MWEPFLWLALVVAAWRWLTRRRGRIAASGPMPDVDNAPMHAEPMLTPRLDDNGLVTYSMVLPGRPRRTAKARERAAIRVTDVGSGVRRSASMRPADGS